MPIDSVYDCLLKEKEEEKSSEYAVASSKVTKDTQQISRLSLEYEAGWLVQRVITRDCMKEYNTIFRLLLEVKRVKYSVVRAHILYMKRGRERSSSNKLYERASRRQRRSSEENVKHSLHIDMAEILHVVGLLELYFMSRVHACWNPLVESISNSESIDEMKSHHVAYLAKIRDICLLRDDTVAVLDAVRNVLSAALKFATVAKEHQDNSRMIRSTRNAFRNVKFLLLLLRYVVVCENVVTLCTWYFDAVGL